MRGKLLFTVIASLGLALLAGNTALAAGFLDQETSIGNTFQAWTSTPWVQTTQPDFEAGSLGQVDTASSPGDVKLATVGNADRIYAFQGGSTAFWRYNITGNSWTPMAVAPAAVGAGGALAYDGSSYIYAFRGGGSTAFWRYDIAGNSWTAMANAPANVGTGGALAYYSSGYVYGFGGNGTTNFWRYDIAGNSWTAMTNAPATVAAGGALACSSSGYVYGFRGNTTATFWRYNIAGNSWTPMTNAPATVAAGGALAYDSSGYVYGFRGNTTATFWRYSIAGNSWTAMTNAPATVAAGGALARDRSGYVYGFRGNARTTFWRYSIAGNSWTAMTNAPANVAAGGALAFVAVNVYASSATIASQVRDTGVAGARWDGLFWDETLPSNTNVTFEVRASDTLFAKDAATPSWTPVGGTSPVTSGLPSGRYMQWRATLTTSDTSKTPSLHSVTIYHYW